MALRFGFRIRYIRESLPAGVESNTYHGSEQHFRPPTRRNHFRVETEPYIFGGTSYNRYQKFWWQPGGIRPIYQDLPVHSKTSLFWCSDSASYLVVDEDCIEKDIALYPNMLDKAKETENEPDRYWRRLSFFHDNEMPNVSKVGYCLGDMRLRAPVPDRWVNVLAPPTQNTQNESLPEYPKCQLIGNLGVLIGMCAFTSDIGNTPQTVQDTFRPQGSGEFRPPNVPKYFHHRNQDLGVVVDIYKDPEDPNPDYLKRWEDGDEGPILT